VCFNNHDIVNLVFQRTRGRIVIERRSDCVQLTGLVIEQVRERLRVELDAEVRRVPARSWVVYEHDFHKGRPTLNLGAVATASSAHQAYLQAIDCLQWTSKGA
jgi:hypothetical protein